MTKRYSIYWTFLLKGIPIPSEHSTNEIEKDIHSPGEHQSDQAGINRSGMSSPRLPLLRFIFYNVHDA